MFVGENCRNFGSVIKILPDKVDDQKHRVLIVFAEYIKHFYNRITIKMFE